MKRAIKLGASMMLMAGTMVLASCKGKEEVPEPEPTPADGPRSIFQEDPAQTGEPVIPAPTLPPLETTLSFADGTPELTEAVSAELATLIESPQVEAGGSIIVRGHSDSAGTDEANLDASRERAEAVRDFLVEAGIAQERIEVIAFGEQNPVEPNALPDGSPNEEGRAANRRVEVTVETRQQAGREQTLIETLTEPEAAEAPSASPASKASARAQ